MTLPIVPATRGCSGNVGHVEVVAHVRQLKYIIPQFRALLPFRYYYTQKGVDMPSWPFLCVLRDSGNFFMRFGAPADAFLDKIQ